MKFRVKIYRDEDGVYIADCVSIPDCVSQCKTEAEAAQNIALAIRECLAARAQQVLPLTVEPREIEVIV